MKINLSALLGLTALSVLSGRAQDVYISGDPGSVTYYAITPVSAAAYQPPVVFVPRPVCHAPGGCAVPVACVPPSPACPTRSPGVIYFGGSYSPQGYGGAGGYGGGRSTVVYFGRGQAQRQGYRFGRSR